MSINKKLLRERQMIYNIKKEINFLRGLVRICFAKPDKINPQKLAISIRRTIKLLKQMSVFIDNNI
jgi:hypothetical protein